VTPRLRAWKAFLIFATFVTAGTVFADALGPVPAGLTILAVGGANAATDWYVAQTTFARDAATPNEQVMVSQATPSAPAVATPAAASLGLVPGAVVDVAPTAGPPIPPLAPGGLIPPAG
jgi:hypothetical protein